MAVDAIPSRSLQDSLTQLAHSFQAHEATTSARQISECLERMPTGDRSALDRLFSLVYRNMVGAAHRHVEHRQIHGADSDLTGPCKHRRSAYLVNRTSISPAGPCSTATARVHDRIGLARRRTIANCKLSALCQTEEKYRQRIFADFRRAVGDHVCNCKDTRRLARTSARSSSVLFPTITVLGRGRSECRWSRLLGSRNPPRFRRSNFRIGTVHTSAATARDYCSQHHHHAAH